MNITRCATCDAPIVWLSTVRGANMPTNLTNVRATDTSFDIRRHTSHFATCTHAKFHRGRRRQETLVNASDDDEYFGEPEESSTTTIDLGGCCICERLQDGTVRNIIMLDFEAPAGTVGWGCVQCHTPSRGAQAVVCDSCIDVHGRHTTDKLKYIAGGHYMGEGQRTPLEGFARKPFGHNLDLHPELQRS